MITFKQYLSEKAMNKSVYADVAKKLSDSALVGFEIELRVSPESDIHRSYEAPEQKSEKLSEFTSMGQFEAFFVVPNRTRQDISNEYEQWVASQEDDWIDDNWENYLDDDEAEEEGSRVAEKSARKRAASEFDSSKLRWRDWLKAEYDSTYDFVNNFTLTPRYGWASMDGDDSYVYTQEKSKTENSWTRTADMLAAEVGERVQDTVHVYDAVGGSHEQWRIVPDTSITDGIKDSDTMTGLGMEIVSPPMLYDDAIDAMEKILAMIDELDLETNDSTGIHLNISIPGIKDKLDPLKLVLFAGDEHVLKVFNRSKNNYAVPQIRHIVDGIQVHGTIPTAGAELLDLARKSLSFGKFVSVNISKLMHGYIEFRAMGGSNYHRELDKIKEAAGRWLTAIDLACDPSAERKEYMKKVVKLLGHTHVEKLKDNVDKSFEELARKVDPESWGRIKQAEKAADVMKYVVKFADEIANKLGGYKPNVKQIGELRMEFKRLGITAEKLKFHQQMQRIGTPASMDRFISMMKVS